MDIGEVIRQIEQDKRRRQRRMASNQYRESCTNYYDSGAVDAYDRVLLWIVRASQGHAVRDTGMEVDNGQ